MVRMGVCVFFMLCMRVTKKNTHVASCANRPTSLQMSFGCAKKKKGEISQMEFPHAQKCGSLVINDINEPQLLHHVNRIFPAMRV